MSISLNPTFSTSESEISNVLGKEIWEVLIKNVYTTHSSICSGCGYEPSVKEELECHFISWDGKLPESSKFALLCEACHSIKHFDESSSNGWFKLVNSKYSQEELIQRCRNKSKLIQDLNDGSVKVLKKTAEEYSQELKDSKFKRNNKIKVVFTKAFTWKHQYRNVFKTKKIAITGGIGSGKTTACKKFESLGVPVYYFDTEAKKFLLVDSVKKQIKEKFGSEVFDEFGNINNIKLREVTFVDKKKVEILANIIHHHVIEDFNKWTAQHSDKLYIMAETAILFKYDLYKIFDYSITVTCPEDIRIERALQRKNAKKEDIMNKINNQWPESKNVEMSDFIINNSETDNALSVRVQKLHNELIEKCSKPTTIEV